MRGDNLIIGSNIPGQRGTKAHRLPEYDATYRREGNAASMYSPQAAPRLVKSHGTCKSCHADAALVSGYCDACRSLGANERECMDLSVREQV